jgi:putative transposase
VNAKKDRFSIIDALRLKYPLPWLFKIAEVSRAGYYKWRASRERAKEREQMEQNVKEHIMAIHRLRPYYGYLRMTVALRKEGLHINHKRVYRLMRDLGISSVIRKKRRYFGKQSSVVNPNRLERQFTAEAPNEKWVTDITYLPFKGSFLYLSAIQDLYNNEVVAYHVSTRNDLALVTATLDKANKKIDVNGTLIHSDQGFQYTSKSYNRRLEQSGMIGSHSRKGNCLDNACIESFFSHLKTEMLYIKEFTVEDDLNQAIIDYITFYNNEWFQKRLGDRSPVEYREATAA